MNNNTFEYADSVITAKGAPDFLKQHKDYYAVIWIPENVMSNADIPMYSFSQVPMELKNEIASQLQKRIEDIKRNKVIAESQMPDLESKLAATHTPRACQDS